MKYKKVNNKRISQFKKDRWKAKAISVISLAFHQMPEASLKIREITATPKMKAKESPNL